MPIKTAREKKALSQAKLAELVGCSQEHISSLERGAKTPSPALAKKIADELQIDVLSILYPAQEEH